MYRHALIDYLSSIGAIDASDLELFHPRVRDRDDIGVLRCRTTELIVLSSIEHIAETDYYEQRPEDPSLQVGKSRLLTPRLPDNIRRAQQFAPLITGKRWIDFGCGLGGMLQELGPLAARAIGLEPNRDRATIVQNIGYDVVANLASVATESVDVVTLFHVLEHIPDHGAVLRSIRERLSPGGTLIVEVPHARDALITQYECEAFRDFTFWSEHLVLHTRESLRRTLENAGFTNVEVAGHQRYPLSNHLYWLSRGRPGGQNAWPLLSLAEAGGAGAYEAALARVDRTDTLLAVARV